LMLGAKASPMNKRITEKEIPFLMELFIPFPHIFHKWHLI